MLNVCLQCSETAEECCSNLIEYSLSVLVRTKMQVFASPVETLVCAVLCLGSGQGSDLDFLADVGASHETTE